MTLKPYPDQPCNCGGEFATWDYHHPTGCAEDADTFGEIADVPVADAWEMAVGLREVEA